MKSKLFHLKFKLSRHFLIITLTYQPKFFYGLISALFFSLAFIFLPIIYSQFRVVPVPETEIKTEISAVPSQITIPIIDLDMPVRPAQVLANDWQVYNDAVSWLNVSGDLSQGNIVLYAHNTKTDFGKIIQMGLGNIITLKNNHQQKQFQVTQIFTATPQDVHLLKNTDQNTLTMYTCSGWFDRDRFFVIAEPFTSDNSQ